MPAHHGMVAAHIRTSPRIPDAWPLGKPLDAAEPAGVMQSVARLEALGMVGHVGVSMGQNAHVQIAWLAHYAT